MPANMNLESEFYWIVKEREYQKELNQIVLNIVLVGLFGSVGVGLVIWRLVRK